MLCTPFSEQAALNASNMTQYCAFDRYNLQSSLWQTPQGVLYQKHQLESSACLCSSPSGQLDMLSCTSSPINHEQFAGHRKQLVGNSPSLQHKGTYRQPAGRGNVRMVARAPILGCHRGCGLTGGKHRGQIWALNPTMLQSVVWGQPVLGVPPQACLQ